MTPWGCSRSSRTQSARWAAARGIDPGNFGGPSNAPVAADDPIFAPIEGISLEEYARVAKIGSNQGVTTEEGLAAVGHGRGPRRRHLHPGHKGWTERWEHGHRPTFRKHFDAAG